MAAKSFDSGIVWSGEFTRRPRHLPSL